MSDIDPVGVDQWLTFRAREFLLIDAADSVDPEKKLADRFRDKVPYWEAEYTDGKLFRCAKKPK